MKIKQLIKALCKAEGKKKQVNIAQMTEIVGVLADHAFYDPEVFVSLRLHGFKRAKKRNAKQ